MNTGVYISGIFVNDISVDCYVPDFCHKLEFQLSNGLIYHDLRDFDGVYGRGDTCAVKYDKLEYKFTQDVKIGALSGVEFEPSSDGVKCMIVDVKNGVVYTSSGAFNIPKFIVYAGNCVFRQTGVYKKPFWNGNHFFVPTAGGSAVYFRVAGGISAVSKLTMFS